MKTKSNNPKEDLQAIREIMERSSKFISLSGLAGVFAGICALAGAVLAWYFTREYGFLNSLNISLSDGPAASNSLYYLMADALMVLVLAFGGAVFFSMRKARKTGDSGWNTVSRRMLVQLFIPLLSGGFFLLILLNGQQAWLLVPTMLIFYGLALVNAGKFTFGEIHTLGLIQILLGILAGFFPEQGLFIWTIGFGFMHILYGSIMYFRHDRKQ